jgi:hypothetical protein
MHVATFGQGQLHELSIILHTRAITQKAAATTRVSIFRKISKNFSSFETQKHYLNHPQVGFFGFKFFLTRHNLKKNYGINFLNFSIFFRKINFFYRIFRKKSSINMDTLATTSIFMAIVDGVFHVHDMLKAGHIRHLGNWPLPTRASN